MASSPKIEDSNDPQMPKLNEVFNLKKSLKVVKLIAWGPFSYIYKLVNIEHPYEHYAMKCEKKSNLRRFLALDGKILTKLNDEIGFPHILCVGQTLYYNYIVMEFLGPSISELRRASSEKKFSVSTSLQIARQTLERIQTLHKIGYINRDVKGSNFAIGNLPDGKQIIYMFDFGFSHSYVDKYGNLLEPRKSTALIGTIVYASLASHQIQEQCRRDDLESWFYMCVEMFTGSLPWEKMEPLRDHEKIAQWKQFVRKEGRRSFLEDMPEEFSKILDIIDALKFHDTPDYARIFSIINWAFKRMDVSADTPFDWEIYAPVYNYAEITDEIGETDEIPPPILPYFSPSELNTTILRVDPAENSFPTTILRVDSAENSFPTTNSSLSLKSCVDDESPNRSPLNSNNA